jgi:carbon-monoxide dehydrogenase medium subunit
MKPAPFEYLRPANVEAAIEAFAAAEGEAKYLAGGQTLGPMLNLRLSQPDLLIDIAWLDDLRGVRDEADAVVLGAGVRHADLEDGRAPDPGQGLMRRAARGLAYRAVRNRGTIGGSVAHADPVAEWPNVLMALDASIHVRGPEGERAVPIDAFFLGYLTTAVSPGELIVAIAIPKLPADSRPGYSKFCRKAGEFADSLAVVVRHPGGGSRAVLGSSGATPTRLDSVSRLLDEAREGKRPGEAEVAARLAEDLDAAGLVADPLDRRVHAATVHRAVEESLVA